MLPRRKLDGVEVKGIVIGITGLAGSGKSLVAANLAQEGFEVYSLDASGHVLLEEPDVKKRLTGEFGEETICAADGTIDRKKLGALVFSSKRKLSRLNAIVHPVMAERAKKWINETRAAGRAGIVEGALVYEFGLKDVLDGVILVDAPFEERLKRLKKSRGWDKARLLAIEAAHGKKMNVDKKVEQGALLVKNTGTTSGLLDKVHSIMEERHWLPTKTKT